MSIAKKITLVVSLLAGLTLTATGYAVMLLKQKEFLDGVRKQADLLCSVLQLAAKTALKDYGHLGALEDVVSRTLPASVIFYGTDGRAVAPVPPEEEPVVSGRAKRVMERNRAEEEMAADGYARRIPLHHQGKVAGAMELRLDLAKIQPEGFLHRGLLAAGALLVAFALLVGLFSRKAIGKPIDQLMDGMDHIIRGDLTHALPLDRNDEIGRIAYRFNEMTAQLRDAQEEIHRNAQAKIQLEQRVRQSEKLATIGQLAAEIAHEVGTPLNVISGRARAIERKAEQADEQTEGIQKNARIISEQAARITKIIQQILDLSRQRIPEKTEVDLQLCINAALSLLEYQLDQSSISINNENVQDLPRVMGDADGLQQVFINLIMNAIQAMPGGGELSISSNVVRRRKEGLDLAPPQLYVSVSISDTGEGIPEELHDQIFEPFYSTKGGGEGTGLGLTVVHGFIKQHDGWIEVSNRSSGGTTFRVFFPVEEGVDDTDQPTEDTED